MPHIGVVMERSLQDGTWKDALVNLLARSAIAALDKRQSPGDIKNDISDAATAFSSWDNCFQAAFCKWPVIALIAIGGLIIFSIVWCIIRCCCCGVSCCCECCYCLKCCGDCCGCCDPPRGKRSQYLDEPFVPPNHNQAYRSQAPMHPGAPMHSGFEPVKPSVPQYAVFETGSKKDADALPAMPLWEEAGSKKVPIEEESVEMEPLQKPEAVQNSFLMSPANRSYATSPSRMSPANVNPYGPPAGIGGPNGHMATGPAGVADPYGMNEQDYSEYDNRGYGQQSGHMNNMPGALTSGPMSRRTPHQDYNTGYDHENPGLGYPQFPQSRSPRAYNDEYGRSGTPSSYNHGGDHQNMGMRIPANDGYANTRRSPAPPAGGYGYGNPIARMGSPGAQAGYGYGNRASPRRSPGPQQTMDYGYSQPEQQRSHAEDEYSQSYAQPQPQRSQTHEYIHKYPPAPLRREYSTNDPHVDAFSERYTRPEPPTSPIRNNGGFDFNSGYSRSGSFSDGPRQSPAPPAAVAPGSSAQGGGAAYPGYRPYKASDIQRQPQQQNWDGL